MNTVHAKEKIILPTIKSLEEGIKTTYQAIAGMLSPMSYADTDEVARVKTAAVQYVNKIQDADEQEMESLMESIIDLISMEYPDEEFLKECLDLEKFGKMGEVMKMYNEYIEALPAKEKRAFLAESMSIIRDGYQKISQNLGNEMTMVDDCDSYEYLLLSQAIFWRAVSNLNWALAELKKKKGKFQEAEAMMIVTNLLVLRVEAFRRGKIDLPGLYKTMTAINISEASTKGEYASITPLDC